ncbi:hypothetical protein [Variovorax ginsengisoli]|uniref:Uncharacterized protein n=1 Tax=Variovorax ginsengisoli TaxID=363844 RepID=A0ABT8SES4_9BURK|nr:hypothetical protein [Variovorax ginsengisoli]MDN8618234.1 hypothetical protein [Variovorax ginsengisoli]MDO1537404.1 hypothetical protein [Variovorax ginsengisoli]
MVERFTAAGVPRGPDLGLAADLQVIGLMKPSCGSGVYAELIVRTRATKVGSFGIQLPMMIRPPCLATRSNARPRRTAWTPSRASPAAAIRLRARSKKARQLQASLPATLSCVVAAAHIEHLHAGLDAWPREFFTAVPHESRAICAKPPLSPKA